MRFFALPLLLSFLITPAIAQDREVEDAGKAFHTKDFVLETPYKYTDIYDRRFDYKKARDQLRANIDQRREHYNSGRTPTIEKYKRNLESLHNSQ